MNIEHYQSMPLKEPTLVILK